MLIELLVGEDRGEMSRNLLIFYGMEMSVKATIAMIFLLPTPQIRILLMLLFRRL